MRYEKYKEAEMPWINNIPSHWSQVRNGGLFDYHQDKVGADFEKYQLLSLSVQGIKVKNIFDNSGKVPASYENYQKVFSGDMVFCLFDLDCSAVFSGLSGSNGMITSAYDVMTPKSNIVNPKYLEYYFNSVFAGRYYKIFAKSVRYTINYDVFKALKSPVPPREEQDQIVRYLDWKVSRINTLIHGYQRQIKLLEERRQTIINNAVVHGILEAPRHRVKAAWMGNVPHDWSEMRMKNFFTEINERSVDGHEPHLSMSQKKGLVTDNENIERRLLSESYAGGKLCQKDDLVLNRLKAHLGVFALAPQLGVISPDYTVLRLNTSRVRPLYAEYLLKSIACRRELRIRVRGIVEGFWRLYTEDLGSIYVCLPPLKEQDQILDYVQGQEQKYKFAIERIEKQISLLKEYRTRLISDVVTGQIDVRNVSIPDYVPEDDMGKCEADEGWNDEEVATNADEYERERL